MPQLLPFLVCTALLAPLPSDATTQWLCSLSDDAVRLVCVADHDPIVDAAAAPPGAGAVVNGTRFPLDSRGMWTVDLWSPPTDLGQLDLLARATICYRSPGCEVQLTLRQTVARR